MKNLNLGTLKLAVIVTTLLMTQSLVAFSQSIINLELQNPALAVAKVRIDRISALKPAIISIKDANGQVLFTEKSKTSQYGKKLDFSKLSNGTYFLDLEEPYGVNRKVLVKTEQGLSLKEGNFYIQNSIRFKDADKKVVVNIDNTLNQPVTIRITDANGNVLHEVNNIVTDNYNSSFNLSSLMRGTYQISLMSGNWSSSQSIKL